MENNNSEFKFNTINEAVEDIKNGKMVIVVDDPDRENEGDIVMAAELVKPEHVNFITKEARGILCLPIVRDKAEELGFDLMVQNNTSLHRTPFAVSIDYRHGTTTGVSASDRAITINMSVDDKATANDFAKPGHIFPLVARRGGVLKRAGHTEAVIDLVRLAGLKPAGILCEITDEDGTMARLPSLMKMAEKFDMKIVTIADLIEYRQSREKLVRRKVAVDLPSKYGGFKLHLYENILDPMDNPIALVKGDLVNDEPVLVRVHSECLTGDVFGSKRCDCGDQLSVAMQMVEKEGRGVVIYMNQEGRGIGLFNKMKAYKLQEEGRDTIQANIELGFQADERDYGVGANILRELKLGKIRLMTNNPVKRAGLEGYGLKIVENIHLESEPNPFNEFYLQTKKAKMGHFLELVKPLNIEDE